MFVILQKNRDRAAFLCIPIQTNQVTFEWARPFGAKGTPVFYSKFDLEQKFLPAGEMITIPKDWVSDLRKKGWYV